ncbi:MAG: hypothetical protein AAGA55_02305 [Planctomycetota bacterium]
MDTTDRAYLSILNWPDGFDEDRKVETLVVCAGMAPYIAGQMARRATPAIVHLFDSLLRDDVVGALHAEGVLALAPTRSEIGGYPDPTEPREVERFPDRPGWFALHDPDGSMWAFSEEQVRLIVAGTVRVSGRIRRPDDSGPKYAGWYTFGGIEGMAGAAVQEALRASEGGWGSGTSRGVRAVGVIDLHLHTDRGPRLVRLSGAAARLGVVGEERGRPSLLDDGKQIDAIRGAMPGAPYEGGFDAFNTPSDVEAMADAAGQGGSRLNPVAFHFFSVWSALIRRSLF